MSKRIEITFSNGDVYSVPAEVVAKDRAEYYAERFEGEEGTYEEIIENEMEVINDKWEILDWISNQMNWEDVEDDAEYVENRMNVDKDSEFVNADKEFIA